ncbi:MAG: sigma-70 family RNA polymerase sigma factor [Verrucomicrobiota bacterium]
MNARTDPQLLRAYAEGRSEAAFAELVRRHIDFVHSAAVRMVNDPHLAKDVSQGVFVALAKDAGKLTNHPILVGWLHRTTRNIAAQTVRTEVRRRHREKEAAAMNESPETDAEWEQISPHLDAALANLSDADRDAVLLRYFENKPAHEMAVILGISAEAAQKRVSRAVERLRENFAKRGLITGAAGLAGVLSANAVQAAPAGFAALVCGSCLSATTFSASAAAAHLTLTMMKKTLIVTAVAAVLTGVVFYQQHDSRAMSQGLPPQAVPRETLGGGALTEQLARAKAAKPPVDRAKELERLKLKWLEIGDRNDKISEQETLAKESAELLLCGREMIDLLKFLKDHELEGSNFTLSNSVEWLFKTARAAEARELLVELPETANVLYEGAPGQGGEAYRDWWSRAAGKTCPEDEFESFRAALNCKSCATEALYGRNERRLTSDPQAAFTSSLEAYRSGIPTISGRGGVTVLFHVKAEQAAKVDFQKWEEQLPPDVQDDEPRPPHLDEDAFTVFRRKLFWNWAEIDPAAAANHVMANPDRLAPRLMEEIVGGYSSYKDRNAIIAWVGTFPEGPYFDAAARSAASYARGTPGIDELIQKVQDPKMREEAAKRAQVPLVNPNTR